MITSNEELEKRVLENQEKIKIKAFTKEMKTFIMTSRFNTKTRKQNNDYRELYWKNGCIYCPPTLINNNIPQGAKIIVLEMDNDINKIFALGLCMNKPFTNKFSVYDDENLNRYSYLGKYRILREELSKEEEDIMKAFDILCFKGNEHLKRQQGITLFPLKKIWRIQKVINIIEFMENIFKKRFDKKSIHA
jgi:hypothetical protein